MSKRLAIVLALLMLSLSGCALIVIDEKDKNQNDDGASTHNTNNRPPQVQASWGLYIDGETASYGTDGKAVEASGAPFDRLEMQLDRIRDPEGHATSVRWIVDSSPTGTAGDCGRCNGMEFSLEMTESGTYAGRAVVRDEYGASTEVPFEVQTTVGSN